MMGSGPVSFHLESIRMKIARTSKGQFTRAHENARGSDGKNAAHCVFACWKMRVETGLKARKTMDGGGWVKERAF